jgi:uncharacterized membrane protein
MLNTVDILIGFTLVMLVMSMAVTMITQLIASNLLNLRGKSLHQGLSHLLALMDQGLTREEAAKIADHVLRNRLVGSAPLLGDRYGLATVIHREELTRLLIDFAVPGPADNADPQSTKAELRAKFRESLARNQIADPAAVLVALRCSMMELERNNPQLSHSMRSNIALLHVASSDFLSKLNSWFDQTVDRTSEVFTQRVRIVTAVVGLVLALLLQLDAVALVNRLSVDPAMRNALVEQALKQASPPAAPSIPVQLQAHAAAPAVQGAALPSSEVRDQQGISRAIREVEALGLVTLPKSPDDWLSHWGPDILPRLFGILLAAALLSLGAPFWYAILCNLLKLRSVIAGKDEEQRDERQKTQNDGSLTQPVVLGSLAALVRRPETAPPPASGSPPAHSS